MTRRRTSSTSRTCTTTRSGSSTSRCVLVTLALLSLTLGAVADAVLLSQAHLSGFFRHAYEADQTSFRQLAETFLNEEEKGVLSHVLQSA